MSPAAPMADPGPLASEVEALNTLLHWELTALATYDQALDLVENLDVGHHLRSIRHHHQTAVAVLRDQIQNLGGTPTDRTGPIRLYDSAPPGVDAGGPAALLEALRIDEVRGIIEYERVLERDEMPDECRFVIRVELWPRCHEHVDALADYSRRIAPGHVTSFHQ